MNSIIVLLLLSTANAQDQSVADLGKKVADLEGRVAALETYVQNLKDACDNVNIDIHSEPAGFKCRTTKGAFFERVSKKGFGEAWKSPDGLVWSEVIPGNLLTLEDAKKKCRDLQGSLPSLAEYQRDVKSGLLQVIPNANASIWTTTPGTVPDTEVVAVAGAWADQRLHGDVIAGRPLMQWTYRCVSQ